MINWNVILYKSEVILLGICLESKIEERAVMSKLLFSCYKMQFLFIHYLTTALEKQFNKYFSMFV